MFSIDYIKEWSESYKTKLLTHLLIQGGHYGVARIVLQIRAVLNLNKKLGQNPGYTK